MITALNRGTYSVSTDGGKTFSDYSNMLLSGFYSTINGLTVCQVGEGINTPIFNDFKLTNELSSSNGTLISTVNTFDNDRNLIIITSQYQYVFPSSVAKTITEVGIRQGTTLVSRALFSAPIIVTPNDHLIVRYTLVTEIDAAPYPVSLDLGGVTYTGTVIKCNPSEWRQDGFGSLKQSFSVASLIDGNYTRGNDGYLTGSGVHKVGYICVTDEAGNANRKVSSITVSSGLDATDITFNVLAISSSNNSAANKMLALIQFDSAVFKSADNIVNAALTIIQEP